MYFPSRLVAATKESRREMRPLQLEALEYLPINEAARVCVPKTEAMWQAELATAAVEGREASLRNVIFRRHWLHLFIASAWRIVAETCNICIAFVLQQFIRWFNKRFDSFSNSSTPAPSGVANLTTGATTAPLAAADVPDLYEGFLWAVALFLANFLSVLAMMMSQELTLSFLQRIRSALTCMIFDKALRLPAGHQLTGNVVAMHSIDTAKFKESQFLAGVCTGGLVVAGTVGAMYSFIGWPAFLALGVSLLVVPPQSYLSSLVGGEIKTYHGHSDQRLKRLSEVIAGIRICKFMGWEPQFVKTIQAARLEEIAALRRVYVLRGWLSGAATHVGTIAQLSMFPIAYAAGVELTVDSVFATIALLNALRSGISSFIMGYGKAVDLLVTLDRIGTFLNRPDAPHLAQRVATIAGADDAAIELKGCRIGYVVAPSAQKSATAVSPSPRPAAVDADGFVTLLNVDLLRIPKGKFTLIVGGNGSGKSLLLSAMVGEGEVRLDGDDSGIKLAGSVTFAAQEAWILNATVKENILLGDPSPHDDANDEAAAEALRRREARYEEAVASCSLVDDLQHLPAGENTEIGERGVSVSGGQRQRIALARAVFANRDIALCDDVLSAVDPGVCSAIVENCILGALGGKTRVLVTHQVHLIDVADHVVVVDDKRILFSGPPQELADHADAHAAVEKLHGSHRHGHRSGTGSKAGSPILTATNRDDSAPPASTTGAVAQPAPASTAAVPAGESAEEAKKRGKIIATEGQAVGTVSPEVYKWYISLASAPLVAYTLLCFATWRAAMIISDFWLSWWLSGSGGFGRSSYDSIEYVYWYIISGAICTLLVVFRQHSWIAVMHRVAAHICDESVIERLLSAPLSFFDTTPAGRILNRLGKDVSTADMLIPELGLYCVYLVFLMTGTLILISIGAVYVLPVIVGVVVFFAAAQRYYTFMLSALKRVESVERSPIMSIMSECLGGLASLRAYQLEGHFARRHTLHLDRMQRSIFNLRIAFTSLMNGGALVSSMIILVFGCFIAIFTINEDAAAANPNRSILIVAVTYSVQLVGNFIFFVSLNAEVDSSFSCIERVKEYATDLPIERDVKYDDDNAPDRSECPRPPANWPAAGAIELRDVELRYRDGLPLVLKGVTLSLKAGQRAAICGRTGSGKSTIMLALMRLVELSRGSIMIDGVDIAKVALRDLRGAITIISQEPLLFNGTFRSNLDPFKLSDDATVLDALRKVGLFERLDPSKGLETEIAERGGNLSVGERQLMCLARAMLKRCRILLVDEASASLSLDADERIQRALRTEFTHCTIITIAHRLATVIDSDVVAVLGDGMVLEVGAPHELLQQDDGHFLSMAASLGDDQFIKLKEAAAAAYAVSKAKRMV